MSLSDIVLALLTEAHFKKSQLTAGLLGHAGDLVYAAEIEHPVDIKSEWHFSALRALPQDVDSFQMQELAADIDQKAPMLSVLLSVLLSARKKLNQHHASDSEADSAMEIGLHQ